MIFIFGEKGAGSHKDKQEVYEWRWKNQVIEIDNMSRKTVLREQYKNTDNLKLRKSLHEKYSVRWAFKGGCLSNIPLDPG